MPRIPACSSLKMIGDSCVQHYAHSQHGTPPQSARRNTTTEVLQGYGTRLFLLPNDVVQKLRLPISEASEPMISEEVNEYSQWDGPA
jgi:hypothetical protein